MGCDVVMCQRVPKIYRAHAPKIALSIGDLCVYWNSLKDTTLMNKPEERKKNLIARRASHKVGRSSCGMLDRQQLGKSCINVSCIFGLLEAI